MTLKSHTCPALWERKPGYVGTVCGQHAMCKGWDGTMRCVIHDATHRMKLYSKRIQK